MSPSSHLRIIIIYTTTYILAHIHNCRLIIYYVYVCGVCICEWVQHCLSVIILVNLGNKVTFQQANDVSLSLSLSLCVFLCSTSSTHSIKSTHVFSYRKGVYGGRAMTWLTSDYLSIESTSQLCDCGRPVCAVLYTCNALPVATRVLPVAMQRVAFIHSFISRLDFVD